MFITAIGAASDCEPPLSRIVLKRDLKDAYKSGKFSSSKVKRSGGSAEVFREATGGVVIEEGTTDSEVGVGSAMVQTDAVAELGVEEKVGTDIGPEVAGNDRAA